MKEQTPVKVSRIVLYVKRSVEMPGETMVRFMVEGKDHVGRGLAVSGEESVSERKRLSMMINTIQSKFLSAA